MGWLFSVEGLVLVGYVACLLALLLFSISQVRLTFILRRAKRLAVRGGPVLAEAGSTPCTDLPYVTIQLPVYNERHVVERLLDAVAAIDYPRDLLEVQVLDDSTDATSAIVARQVDRLAATGRTITHVRRSHRSGFKAGALAHGLARARGELLVIFDADFVPLPDFLRVTVPFFDDPDVGAVQTRWGHLNEHESALTRVQAFLLDLHFRLEQPARHLGGLFLNFNGTAGIWRRTAIEDAGGWSDRTLTEDIDLSYRAQLRGWRLVYLPDYACPGELPGEMGGLRSQQHRWMKGGAQNARLHLRTILGAPLSAKVRRHACQHLLAGSMYLVILAAVLLSVPLAAVKNTAISADYADFGIPFVLSTVGLVAVFHTARRPRGIGGQLRFVGEMACFMVFTMGLAVHNGGAVLSGWSGRGGEFVRTPKYGTGGWTASAYTRRSPDARVLPELAVLGILAVGLAVGWRRREFALYPLQLMAAAGLVWVVALSVWHPVQARRSGFGARRPAADADGVDVIEEVLR